MKKISVVISAFNEEKKIEMCLQSVQWVDEIVVIDNSSTDRTAEIARKYTKHVYHHENDPQAIDLQKNFGVEKAHGDWILVLDADEIVTEELAEEIKETIGMDSRLRGNDKDEINGFWIPRKNIIFGKWIEHSGWYPDYQLRLFKRGKGKFEKKHVHEPITVTGDTAKLKQDILHYNYETIAQFVQKSFLLYAPNEAEERLRKGYTFDFKDAIRFPFAEFISRYFAREGYKDGFHGLMLAMLMAFYHFLIFAYLWEKKDFIVLDNDDVKKELKETIKKSKKDLLFWITKRDLENEKNQIKRLGIKLKKKFL